MMSRSMALHGRAQAPSADWQQMSKLGYAVIIGGFGAFLVWTMFSRLDGAVVAPGTVSVESSRKTIQHLEGGIVREILVRDGDLVQSGSVLIRLDPTRIDSASERYRIQLATTLAQEARLLSERDMRDTVEFPKEVQDQAGNPAVARAIDDQRKQFEVRRENLMQAIQVASAQTEQAKKEAQQNDVDNETARSILGNLSKEIEGVQFLYEKNLVALPRLTSLQREQSRIEGVISNTEAGKVRLADKVRELDLRREKLTQDYRQDAAASLGDIGKSIAELRQQLIVANDSQDRIELRSPITGVVQQLRVFTVGGVVRPGDPLMDIVPTSDDLIIRAKVAPLDADRIRPDMDAEVRFPSFRALGLPVIRGKVVATSRDRLLDDVTKDPYFDAQVNVGRHSLPPSLADKLSAGMPAEVIMPTGERTVLDYLIAPILERFHTSMRER